ncbi:hypothetical protein EV182_004154 [Spiromyces aspiralis]|uniref:Uncharacterized protein n=1 Tax=Spiromyces aspiralis TaxID=68401 RepID=A0ACC1HJB0_9FUNG|nr:hypothetical protein EV182_004154 [Spiromyces aspiralis]
MRVVHFLASTITALASVSMATPYYTVDNGCSVGFDVTISQPLTTDNFTQLVSAKDTHWFIKFYSPTCKYSKAIAPEWVAAVEKYGSTACQNRIYFGEVNCPDNLGLCEQNNIEGYPTVNYYSNGSYSFEYEGEREAQDLINFASQVYRGISNGTLT